MKSIALMFNDTNTVTSAQVMENGRITHHRVTADEFLGQYTTSLKTVLQLTSVRKYIASHGHDVFMSYLLENERDFSTSVLVMLDRTTGLYFTGDNEYTRLSAEDTIVRGYSENSNAVVLDIIDTTTLRNSEILKASKEVRE